MEDQRARPHTGRRRNEAARAAILRAALALVERGEQFGMGAIAQAAGVGKQTIYRWWPSRGAVLAEALAQQAESLAHIPDTGSVRADLAVFLADTFQAAAEPPNRRVLQRVMADAQDDPHLEVAVAEFTARRRAELGTLLERGRRRGELVADADLDLVVDQAYGMLWYRLLIGHSPLDRTVAERLAESLLTGASVRGAGR
ncbi:TetR/AcrR family transcriptional regulator C-terminal ligand-binding domain-containing protein [Saccharopolyspora sp. SCSIO 74807]|uniref:TetR/AcrR family transcriptional regulator n=1 Tax=Saccharopolyspora sp. SCSIO 74807 TaxID=3118084 RepID=UPI0030D17EFA